jgi:hypothetical protein
MPRPASRRLALWSLAAVVGLAGWGAVHAMGAPDRASAGPAGADASLRGDPVAAPEAVVRGESATTDGSSLTRVGDRDRAPLALGMVAAAALALTALWPAGLAGTARPTLGRRRHVIVVRGPPAVASARI